MFYKVRLTRFSGKRFAGDGDMNMPQAGPYDRRLHVAVGEQGPYVWRLVDVQCIKCGL